MKFSLIKTTGQEREAIDSAVMTLRRNDIANFLLVLKGFRILILLVDNKLCKLLVDLLHILLWKY